MKRVGLWFILALLLVSLATPVLADDPDGDVVIWGKNYVLQPGQKIKGDLLVYGGSVTLKAGSEVEGDVTVFGGTLTVSGKVQGDVTVWGGNVNIKSGATVRGQVVSVGGNVTREEGADVRGSEIEGFPFRPPAIPKPPIPPQIPGVRTYRHWGSDVLRGIGSFFRSVFGILLMVVLGILVVVFIPRHTEMVAETMIKAPLQCLLSGLVALIAGSIVLVVLSIIGSILTATICLAPVGLALFLPVLVAGIAVLFGWIATGLLLGVKVLRATTHQEPNQVAAVAVGVLLLSLISFIPCVGWALALAAVMWSLGAVIYSLFGTRPWAGTAASAGAHRSETEAIEEYDPRMDQL